MLSAAEVKVGLLIGPHIKNIPECKEFPEELTRKKKAARDSFVVVVWDSMGNHEAEGYFDSDEELKQNGLQDVP